MQPRDAGKSGSLLSSCCNIPEESTIYVDEKSFKTSKRVPNNPNGTRNKFTPKYKYVILWQRQSKVY
jgi:hypothetical protein